MKISVILAVLVLLFLVPTTLVFAGEDSMEVMALLEIFNPTDRTSYFILYLNPVDEFESMVEKAKKSAGIEKVIIVRPSFVFFNREHHAITIVPINIE